MYCGGQCETVEVGRTRMYYFGYTIMLIGAASAFIPRFQAVSTPIAFIIMGLALAVVGSVAVIAASIGMAREAAKNAENSHGKEVDGSTNGDITQ